ncbi:HD domain-containing protein [Desulfopila sp. IMCC35006]|uniref:HD domain-containing protein n=1 Tax=Desulfopila sp. IMCC35006 TaxID=2569542 RepID=UPI0010AD41F7|nr:HD domain-containing protein [Desulfopila sp. IMCC35006]TKB26208.1 HD domain-containing protein [Desulfopila sp. IMCC35006]
MNEEQCNFFQQWAKHHILTFQEVDPLHQQSLDLKEAHTFRVCAAIARIASGLGLMENDIRIAFVTALFHDIGRFPQYQKYRTFRDLDSDNHAKLSLWELNRHRVLHTLNFAERRIISLAILFHNRLRLPENLDPQTLLHCQLIRDADKIDILRVMSEHFQMAESLRNPVITLGLGTGTQVREEVYRMLLDGRIMNYGKLKTINELKVLQMSWVFDIHFRPTFVILRERDNIGAIAATLPDTPLLREALDFVNSYIEKRLKY